MTKLFITYFVFVLTTAIIVGLVADSWRLNNTFGSGMVW